MLTFIMSITCYAQVTNFETSYNKNSLTSSSDCNEVKRLIKNRKVNELIFELKGDLKTLDSIGSPNELTYGNSYKVFYIEYNELVKALSSNKKVSELISDTKYIWETPLVLKNNTNTAVGSFTAEKFKNSWEICEIGGSIPPQEVIFSSQKDQIEKVFEQNGVSAINSYLHIRVSSIYKDYLVIDSNSSEVYIELDDFKESKPEKALMNAEELKQDVLEREKTIYGESKLAESGSLGNELKAESASANQMNFYSVIVLSVTAIFLVGLIIYVKRRYKFKGIPSEQADK